MFFEHSGSERAAAQAWRFSGTHACANPEFACIVVVGGASSGAAADPPNLAPSWGCDCTYWVAAGGIEIQTADACCMPSCFSCYVNTTTSNGGNGARISSMRRTLKASSLDPTKYDWGTEAEDTYALTFAIRPAAACAPVTSPSWTGSVSGGWW